MSSGGALAVCTDTPRHAEAHHEGVGRSGSSATEGAPSAALDSSVPDPRPSLIPIRLSGATPNTWPSGRPRAPVAAGSAEGESHVVGMSSVRSRVAQLDGLGEGGDGGVAAGDGGVAADDARDAGRASLALRRSSSAPAEDDPLSTPRERLGTNDGSSRSLALHRLESAKL